MNITEFKKNGWGIDEDLLKKFLDEEEIENKDIIDIIQDTDIKLYGKPILTNALDRQKGFMNGPVVLQLVKFKNVSHSQDGFNNVNGINFKFLKKISSNTPPGTKVLFKEKITFSDGLLLLSDDNIKVLGGNVEKLINRWKMDKIAISGITNLKNNGVPRWIPFSKTQQFKNDQKNEIDYVKKNNALQSGMNNMKNEKTMTTNKKTFKNQKVKSNESQNIRNKNTNNIKSEPFDNEAVGRKVFVNNSHTTNRNNDVSRKTYVNNKREFDTNNGKSNNYNENDTKNMPFSSTNVNNQMRGNFSNTRGGNRGRSRGGNRGRYRGGNIDSRGKSTNIS
ncbi:RE01471p [Strongyloides ratti]|uniref:RE01471p n=1 Tax=Strongyloides ratti TaxID=34506 RepID=A0A090LNA9_STRRB|nr:RE01471p [Strongyloides ratti]CEF69020.1 RE01471p [Strongyloides ratti]